MITEDTTLELHPPERGGATIAKRGAEDVALAEEDVRHGLGSRLANVTGFDLNACE